MTILKFKPGRVVAVGECMIELARSADQRLSLAYGGDTFNTAVYLARAGTPVAYATALGDDPYSEAIMGLAGREGVDTDLITMMPGRMPGLYIIETSEAGERSFWYWRDRAAARELFDGPEAGRVLAGISQASAVYFSGVTLSLYSAAALERFAAALAVARNTGAVIVMDSNYRPRGWKSDKARAREVFVRFWRLSTIAMPTFDDEQALWGDASPAGTLDRLTGLGVPEIVIKCGKGDALVRTPDADLHVPSRNVNDPVDTTAAGDSFDAAYLAGRMRGLSPQDAAALGHDLAAIVIAHRGAIIPRAATASLLKTPPFKP
jgi:2-dehydro-3-deoxygluconokinase